MITPHEPKVSVVIPVYNAGAGLRHTVDGVLSQTYRNLELILVNDGSTDDSAATCEELARADDRVVVIHQANGGVSVARNAGLARARGELIAFVDADDRLHRAALSSVIPLMQPNRADMACFGMVFEYYDGSTLVDSRTMQFGSRLLIDTPVLIREHFFELYKRNYLSSVCNKVFRTQFLRDNKIEFDSRMAVLEDLEFVVKALSCRPTVLVLQEPLYGYRNDLSVSIASRRPRIDYLRCFHALDSSLGEMAAVLSMDTPQERGRLAAITFRAYLTGLELAFAYARNVPERHRAVQEYLADRQVVQAAVLGQNSARWATRIAARCVVRQRALPLHCVLLAVQWVKQFRRRLRRQRIKKSVMGPLA